MLPTWACDSPAAVPWPAAAGQLRWAPQNMCIVYCTLMGLLPLLSCSACLILWAAGTTRGSLLHGQTGLPQDWGHQASEMDTEPTEPLVVCPCTAGSSDSFILEDWLTSLVPAAEKVAAQRSSTSSDNNNGGAAQAAGAAAGFRPNSPGADSDDSSSSSSDWGCMHRMYSKFPSWRLNSPSQRLHEKVQDAQRAVGQQQRRLRRVKEVLEHMQAVALLHSWRTMGWVLTWPGSVAHGWGCWLGVLLAGWCWFWVAGLTGWCWLWTLLAGWCVPWPCWAVGMSTWSMRCMLRWQVAARHQCWLGQQRDSSSQLIVGRSMLHMGSMCFPASHEGDGSEV